MTIQRTDIEILDAAIQFAKDLAILESNLQTALDYNPEMKKVLHIPPKDVTDIEFVKAFYKKQMALQQQNTEFHFLKQLRESELKQKINNKKENIELIRWLYKNKEELNNLN